MKMGKSFITNYASSTSSLQEDSSNSGNVQKISAGGSNSISDYLSKKEAQTAEIVWALKVIKSHYSYKSSEDISKLFSIMFPDSTIASQFSCGERKLAYMCCFGIAPHFQKVLIKCFDESEHYTVLFDETLNHSMQEKQMDIYVKFWHSELNEVCTRYYTSVFMGHATAHDILNAFYDSTKDLNLQKVIQISMDGPAVNWAFYDRLQNEVKENYGCQMLNVGSCSLHVLNNGFKHGESETDWDISYILSSLYYLFKDSPARRNDFFNSSKLKKAPLKFVGHRWLENVPCAERALEIWQDVLHYVECVKKGTYQMKNPPKSFSVILNACKDLLTPLKITIFLTVAKLLLPFLTLYQSDKPLLPFLPTDVLDLFKQCMLTFNIIKSDKLKKLSTPLSILCKFDFDAKSEFTPINDISVGFVAGKMLSELKQQKKITEQEILSVKHNCQKFIVRMLHTIIKKCPINYAFVRHLVCLDPRLMASEQNNCISKMQKILEKLNECEKFQASECENVILQYRAFLNSEVKFNISEFSGFSVRDTRLDTFLTKYARKPEYKDVWRVMKCLLVFSHGQATVERGFSVNKHIEVENLKKESYISQKVIYDQISFVGGVEKIEISKELRASVSVARQAYMNYLDKQRLEKLAVKNNSKRKELENEFNELNTKRQKMEKNIKELENSADNLAEIAETLKDCRRFIDSNNLRKQAKEQKAELEKIKKAINQKKIELKN